MEPLPEALAAIDARKRTMVKSIADLLQNPGDKLAQMLASMAEDTRAMPQAQEAAMSVMPEVAAGGRQQMVQQAGGMVGTTSPVDAVRAQLAPYQHQVFDRLYAATKDLNLSFTKTKELTNLMTGGKSAE
jgi:hypothetical protein